METHPTVVIKFDVFGNQLIFPESIEKDKIIPIDKTEIKNEILKEIPDFKSDLRKLKDDLANSFNSLFSISKSYIGFKNRRLVSVSEGKDNNDVVIMKQVKKMLEDSIREKRSIDMEDINVKLMDYLSKRELNDLFMSVVQTNIDFLGGEIHELNNKFSEYVTKEEFENLGNLLITKKELDNKIEKLSSVLISDVIEKVKQEQSERTKIYNKIEDNNKEINDKIINEISQVKNEFNEQLTSINDDLRKLIRLVMDEIVPKVKRLN